MSHKEDGDPNASALVQKRWDRTPAAKRTEHARKMAEARWAGHVAKRPASSRKGGGKRGRPPGKKGGK